MEFTRTTDNDLVPIYAGLLETAIDERKALGLLIPDGYRIQVKRASDPLHKYNATVITSEKPLLTITHAGKPTGSEMINTMRASIDEIAVLDSGIYKEYDETKRAFSRRQSGNAPTPNQAERYLRTLIENLPLLVVRKELFNYFPLNKWDIQSDQESDGIPLSASESLKNKILTERFADLAQFVEPAVNVLTRHGRSYSGIDVFEDLADAEKSGHFGQELMRFSNEPTGNEIHNAQEVLKSQLGAAALNILSLVQMHPSIMEEAFMGSRNAQDFEEYLSQYSQGNLQ